MELLTFTKSECTICYANDQENDYNIICPMCKQAICKSCIYQYNTINKTNLCSCPSCKHKYNKLISYLIFGDECNFFVKTQVNKYRNIIMINQQCSKFYKLFSEINKSSLNLLLEEPNSQMLLSYYIDILTKRNKFDKVNLMYEYVNDLFNEDNIMIICSSKHKTKEYNKLIHNANKLILNKEEHLEWTVQKDSISNAYGVDCYYIKRNPQRFICQIDDTHREVMYEEVQYLCPPRTRYLNERLIQHLDVEFDNKQYGCCHCETFVLDMDLCENNKNKEFNKKDLLLGDDYSKFTLVGDQPLNSNDIHNMFDGGYIVVRKKCIEELVDKQLIELNKSFNIMTPIEQIHQYYLYISTNILNMYSHKSQVKKMIYTNKLKMFIHMLTNYINNVENNEHNEIIMKNIFNIITTHNFKSELIDLLKEQLIINGGSNDLINEINKFIRDFIYKDTPEEQRIKLDSLLISTCTYDTEYRINYIFTQNDVTYKDIFGELNNKYKLTNKNSTITFQQCNCGGYIIVNENKRVCIKCNKEYCIQCNEIKEENHICDQKVLDSLKLITDECVKCPCCRVPIYRTEGCNHMFCTNCHGSFDWNTGEQISEDEQSNPLYFEWKANHGKEENIKINDELLSDNFVNSSITTNPLQYVKYQYKECFDKYSEELELYQDEFASKLTDVMEFEDVAIRILNNINKCKCKLTYVKYSYDKLRNKLNSLDYSKLNKQDINNILIDHLNKFNEQRSNLDMVFIISTMTEKKIKQLLKQYISYHEKLYKLIIEVMTTLGYIENNEYSDDFFNNGNSEEVKQILMEHDNRFSVCYHERFNSSFDKIYSMLTNDTSHILTFDEIKGNI